MKIQPVFRLLLLFLLLSLVWAVPQAAAQPATEGPSDPVELETFLDGVMAAEMESNHVAGAVVLVVKDGQIFWSKGYGFSDLEEQTPVDPARTLFRPGSVSKLFVWTAVMQLVEQGKLSPDADINTYLDFEIPATYPEPITLKHLLTHTPGFEDKGEDLFKLDAEDLTSLDAYLKTHLPRRVFPPGQIGAYSNYGTALAGYIVERVSGQPFDEYVEEHIFAPLEMMHSTFHQPLPAELAADMSNGYNYYNGGYVQGGFEFIQAYPAGSLSASATDMANFMIAHLQNGRYHDTSILSEETTRQMHSQLFTHDSRLTGMAYGFFESTLHNQRIISHGGDTILFHTGLFLLPEQNLGIFISTNSTGGAVVPGHVLTAFMDRYYPMETQSAVTSTADFDTRIRQYAGEYHLSRNNFTTFEKILMLMSPVSVTVDEQNNILLSGGGQTTQYTEIEPGLLQSRENPDDRYVMKEENGQVYLYSPIPFVFIKSPWYSTTSFHLLILMGNLLLFLGVLIGWGISFFSGLFQRESRPFLSRLARGTGALFGVLFLVFIIMFAAVFLDIDPAYGVPRIFFEVPALFNLLTSLPIIMSILGIGMVVFTVVAWRNRFWSMGDRLFYTFLTLSAWAFLWELAYWNFLL